MPESNNPIRPPRATLNQLRTFEAVARLGGIGRAAEALHLAQPTVSSQLRELCDGVGVALLEPLGRSVRLTDAGRALQQTALAMFAAWGNFEATLDDLAGLRRGVLRIAGVSTTEYFLAQLLKTFAQQWPGIEIDLAIDNRQAVVARLEAGADDVAVMMLPPAHVPLAVFPFMDNPLVVVGAAGHPWAARRRPVALRQLAAAPMLVREAGSGTRLATENFFASKALYFSPRMTLGSNEAVKHAVAAGLGLAVLSRHAFAADPAQDGLALLPVQGFPLRRTWQLVWRQDRQMPLAALSFVAFIKAQAQCGNFRADAQAPA